MLAKIKSNFILKLNKNGYINLRNVKTLIRNILLKRFLYSFYYLSECSSPPVGPFQSQT